jgi:hypothetical protein
LLINELIERLKKGGQQQLYLEEMECGRLIAGSCEYGYKPLGFMSNMKILDHLSHYQLLNKGTGYPTNLNIVI